MSTRVLLFTMFLLGLGMFIAAVILAEQTPGENGGYQALGFVGVIMGFLALSEWEGAK